MQRRTIILAAGALLLAACTEMAGPMNPAALSRLTLAVSTRPSVGPTALDPAETFTDGGGNTLTVDSAFVVVRKMRLQGGPVAVCAADSDADRDLDNITRMHDSVEAEHDWAGGEHSFSVGDQGGIGMAPIFPDDGADEGGGCGVLKAGPLLVQLPLAGGAEQQFTAAIDSGTYTSVLFQIHRPAGAADTAFLAAHPEYRGVSIRVAGHWNGVPFVFTTGVTDVQRVDFDPPLVVGADPGTFTLMVDMSGWFRSDAGTLLDPATALDDSTNAPLVHRNIERSFHAFRDDDHDGADDHLEHQGR